MSLQALHLFIFFTIFIVVCKGTDHCSVHEHDTFDCHPEFYANKEACEKKGCCWREYPDNHGQPFCFFPSDQPSYKLLHWTPTDFGYEASLLKVGPSLWPREVTNVTLKIWFETETRLRFKFYDASSPRWEVPIETPAPSPSKPANVSYNVEYVACPFGIRVTRKSNAAVLFDSAIATSPLSFSDQFLQISTRLSSPLVYGIGERYGPLLINATSTFHRFALWNRDQWPSTGANLYGSHPFLLNPETDSPMAHGIFLLNSNAMEIEVQAGAYATFRTTGGVLDFYVYTGPSAEDVVQQHVHTIGLPSLPPLWSLGFHLCRWKYHNTTNLRAVVERNRALGIPYEAQWSDIDYMQDARIWSVDQSHFSNLPSLVRDLHQHGQRYVVIVDPAVAVHAGGYPPYDRGLQMGVFVKDWEGEVLQGKVWPGLTVFPDFSHPNASEWWWQLAQDFHDVISYDALWIDMNEPSSFVTGSTKGCSTGPLDNPPYTPRVTGGSLAAMTLCPSAQQHLSHHYNLHNLYGLQEAVVTHQALKRIRPGKRPFILSRSTFPSHGKWAQHWTGDVTSSWQQLQHSIPSVLSMGMFGVGMVGADICGFNGDTTQELCLRWMQLGAFYPFMRNHNDDKSRDQDPAVWDRETREAMKMVTEMRYSLIPFFYTQFYHHHTSGRAVIRPLFFVYPDDEKTYGIEAQFMWGSCLLISPALEEGQRTVRAYLPKDNWFNLLNSQPIRGHGEFINISTPLTSINVHLRGGAVLPWQQAANNTNNQRRNKFKLTVALDSRQEASGDLFWDDGESSDSIQQNHFSLIHFVCQSNTLRGSVSRAGYRAPGELGLAGVFVLGLPATPSHVTFNSLPVNFEFDDLVMQLTVPNLSQSLLQPFVLAWE